MEEEDDTDQFSRLLTLAKRVEDLKTLIEVSNIISSTFDLNELTRLVMEKALYVVNAEGCSILLYDKKTDKLQFELVLNKDEGVVCRLKDGITLDMGQGIAGVVARDGKPILVRDAAADKRFFGGADTASGFKTRSIIAAPLSGRRGLIGVAEVLNPQDKAAFDEYDMELFATLCSQAAVAMENIIYHEESLKREKFQQEIEIAAALQRSFLPLKPVFEKGDLIVSAINIPAGKVSGDMYYFVEPARATVGVLIGDVSGKGISAAMYMAKAASDFRYMARASVAPADVLDRLNMELLNSPRGMFLTAIYMTVDLDTGTLDVAAAGHPPFLLIRDGEVTVMDVASGPPLGIMPVEYPTTKIALGDEARIFLLTDGVYDAVDVRGRRLGFDRFVDFIRENAANDGLLHMIAAHVKDFSGGLALADDLTVMELKWLKKK
jgi:sigma-B regulation protein RsbU (phosphoserine phosphatase)